MARDCAVVFASPGGDVDGVVRTVQGLGVEVIRARNPREVGLLTERHSPAFLVLEGPLSEEAGVDTLGWLRQAGLDTPAVVLCGSRYESEALAKRDDLRPFLPCRTFDADVVGEVLVQVRMRRFDEDFPESGRIEEMELTHLLLATLRRRWTGRLVLESGGVKKTIYIAAGLPVYCSSSILSENFGRLLLKRGVISRDDYEQARTIQLEQGVRQGEALVLLGAISEESLQRYLTEQAYEKLLNGLAWTGGHFALNDDDSFGGQITVCHINLIEALIEAYERFYAPLEVAARWPRLRHLWGIASCDRADVARLVEQALPLDFLTALREPRILCELAEENGWPPERAVAVFSILEQAGYIELAENKLFLPLGRSDETRPPLAAVLAADVGPENEREVGRAHRFREEAERLIQELYEAYFRVSALVPAELLGISSSASREQVLQARERVLDHYSAERFAPILENAEHERALDSVRRRIEAAAAELLGAKPQQFDVREPTHERTTDEVSMRRLVEAEEAFLSGLRILNKDSRSALEHFERAAKLHPKDPLYLLYHGWSLYLCSPDDERRQVALSKIEGAVHANPASAEASVILARVLFDRGQISKALERIKIALAFEPNHREAKTLLAEISAGTGSRSGD